MPLNLLTDADCRAQPHAKPFTRMDGGGLYLEIKPNGSRHWYITYRLFGRRPRLALGPYPGLSLVGARRERTRVQDLVRENIDPALNRKMAKAEAAKAVAENPPFATVADEWFAAAYPVTSMTPGTRGDKARVVRYLKNGYKNKALALGKLPIKAITRAHVAAILAEMDAAGVHAQRRLVQNAAVAILEHAVGPYLTATPLVGTLGVYQQTANNHHAAQHEPEPFGAVLRKIAAYDDARFPLSKYVAAHWQIDKRIVRAYYTLLALLFVRPQELRVAEWSEFNFTAKVWTVPFERLKQRTERKRANKTQAGHKVPLASQTIAVLRELQALTGEGRFLFPSVRKPDRPIGESTLAHNIRAAGIDTQQEQTGHGFRASAKTMLKNARDSKGRRLFYPDMIEAALNHINDDPYDRGDSFEDRIDMMQWWANKLDIMRNGAQVVPIRHKRRAS